MILKNLWNIRKWFRKRNKGILWLFFYLKSNIFC
jgi:hypothetical protein